MMLWGAVLWLFLLYLMQMHSNKAFKTSLYSKNCENRTNHLLLEY